MSSDSIDTPPPAPARLSKRSLPPEVAAAATIVKLVGSCVYFLLDEGRVVYVGSSKVGSKRAISHVGRLTFDSVAFLDVDEAERDNVERRYIRQLNPKYNRAFTTRAKKGQAKPKGWPLTLKLSGQWCKRYKGKTYYFGTDKDAALKRFGREWSRIQAGHPREGVSTTPFLT